MGRAKESFGKKEVRNKQQKKRKEKEKRKQEKKEQGKNSFDDMLAWVDENGQICTEPPSADNKQEVKAEHIEISIPKGGGKPKNAMHTGRIRNFDEAKGYGFIRCAEINEAVFFHINDCDDDVNTGNTVEFKVEKGQKGLKATSIKKVG
jgi:cold shock CspA family protein